MRAGGGRVAVVGATGNVGRVMLEVLRERDFPADEIVLFASPRSAGLEIDGRPVHVLDDDADLSNIDVALFSAGASTSRTWGPRFVEAGAVVVDNSSAFRRDPEVPLVVSEVNPHAIARHHGIIANPNCSTMQLMVALAPIHRAVGIERLIVSTYQSVSGTGKAALTSSTPSRGPRSPVSRCLTRRSIPTTSRSTSSAPPGTSSTATTTPTRSAR